MLHTSFHTTVPQRESGGLGGWVVAGYGVKRTECVCLLVSRRYANGGGEGSQI